MKSNIILTSTALLMASAAGAQALEARPFVGLRMGLNGVVYSDATKDATRAGNINLPEDFVAFGAEAGARFGSYNDIYNYGLTFNFDITTDSDIEQKFGSAKLGDLYTSNYSLTYDNYIRISGDKSKRIDLVLGAGLGTMNYNIDWKHNSDDDSIYSPTIAMKAGLDFELNKHLTLSADARFFVPTRSHYAADTTYIVGGAIKYLF